MGFSVKCPCGQTIAGETEDDLVNAANAHGNEVHGMTVPREQILGMAQED